MNTLKTILLTAALLPSALLSTLSEAAEPECNPPVLSARTNFPATAQEQRRHGVVRVAVKLQEDGKAYEAEVARSSGHAALDRAAVLSVKQYWRFDVSKCAPSALTQAHLVDVIYRRPGGLTLSGTVNPKFRASTAKLAAESQCDVTRVSADTKIFACKDEPLLNVARK